MQTQLAQANAQTETETGAETCADAEGYPYCDPCCYKDDKDYYCKPVLDDCPGVYQAPGPCIDALCHRPLCYCNTGYLHTDWDHTVKINGKKKDDYGYDYEHDYDHDYCDCYHT